MSIEYTAEIWCGAPGCVCHLRSTSKRPIYGDNFIKDARLKGWYMEDKGNGEIVAACADHRAEADAAEQVAYDWARARTDDMNKARKTIDKARKAPEVAPWLAPIVEARRAGGW